FGLCKEIGEQHVVVFADGVVRLCRCDEVARNQLGTLMDKLIKGMLSVGAGLAPDDGPGLVIHRMAFAVYVFAIALHITLLEISGKAVQVLVVGEDSLCFGIEEVVVPY